MTQLTADNSIKQAVSLTEFVDSVFDELSSHDNKWNRHEEGYGYFNNPNCWKNTIIPLAIRLNELAKTDITVYWWLLRQMSVIDSCKDGKKFFGKSDVYEALSKIGLERSGFVLKNGLSGRVDVLFEALKAKNLDTFMNYMPFERSAALIYSICRVLKRVGDVRNIYEDTLSHTKGDALGKLFLLFRRYYQYFAEAYEEEQRSCDGMAKNIFLALYQTQFRIDKNVFCYVAERIGDLWVKSLILAYLNDKDQIPQSVCDVMYEVFQEGEVAKVFKSLGFDFKNHGSGAMANVGGWMEMEKYSFIWKDVLDHEWRKTMPPFSCKIVDGKRRPVVKGRERRDNCNTYLKSKNAIPLAELLKHRNEAAKPFELVVVDSISASNSVPMEPAEASLKKNNEEVREIISELIPAISYFKNNKYSEQTFIDFFDAILINPLTNKSEEADRDRIVSELLSHKGGFLFDRIKANVFCLIIGHLIRNGFLCDKPTGIAKKLMPSLDFPKEKNEEVVRDTIRSYIQDAKKKKAKEDDKVPIPPGIQLIDSVLKRLK